MSIDKTKDIKVGSILHSLTNEIAHADEVIDKEFSGGELDQHSINEQFKTALAQVNQSIAGGLVFKGPFPKTANLSYAKPGYTYIATYDTNAYGLDLEVGDVVIVNEENPTVAGDFIVINKNITNAVTKGDATSDVGSNTRPVYVNHSGVVKECNFVVRTSVPENVGFVYGAGADDTQFSFITTEGGVHVNASNKNGVPSAVKFTTEHGSYDDVYLDVKTDNNIISTHDQNNNYFLPIAKLNDGTLACNVRPGGGIYFSPGPEYSTIWPKLEAPRRSNYVLSTTTPDGFMVTPFKIYCNDTLVTSIPIIHDDYDYERNYINIRYPTNNLLNPTKNDVYVGAYIDTTFGGFAYCDFPLTNVCSYNDYIGVRFGIGYGIYCSPGFQTSSPYMHVNVACKSGLGFTENREHGSKALFVKCDNTTIKINDNNQLYAVTNIDFNKNHFDTLSSSVKLKGLNADAPLLTNQSNIGQDKTQGLYVKTWAAIETITTNNETYIGLKLNRYSPFIQNADGLSLLYVEPFYVDNNVLTLKTDNSLYVGGNGRLCVNVNGGGSVIPRLNVNDFVFDNGSGDYRIRCGIGIESWSNTGISIKTYLGSGIGRDSSGIYLVPGESLTINHGTNELQVRTRSNGAVNVGLGGVYLGIEEGSPLYVTPDNNLDINIQSITAAVIEALSANK